MFKKESSEYLESSSLSKVIFNSNGTAKNPKWVDKTDEPSKIFEIETRQLFLKLGAEIVNTNRCLLDLSETKSAQKKYDVDCLAIIKKPNLKDDKAGFVLICECKTTKSERMKAINHGFFNKIKTNKSFITQRLNKIFKEKYIPIFILATDGFKCSPEIKKKYLDEKVILMSEVEAKYLSDCYDVSKNHGFTFNQFLTFFRSKSQFYENLCVGAFETHTDFLKKKNAYTFSAKARQMIQLTGVAHKVAKDLISDEEGKLLNTDHYQRVLKKGRLSNLGEYLDNEKKPFNNNILLSYRGTNKDFNFNFYKNIGEGRTGELTIKGKPGSFHVIDGQHRLFGYMAANDDRVLDQTIIVTAFKDLTQVEEAQIFLDVNSNQKKVDIGLRREVQLILGDSATGQEQLDNLATLIVLGLRENIESPFNKNPVSIPLPESGGILQVEQLRKALLNGNLLGRNGDFKKGQLCVDDNFQTTYEFSLKFLIDYFIDIRAAVEKSGNHWFKPLANNKLTALRTNFICGCIALLERIIDKEFRGKNITPNRIRPSIEKYIQELCKNINSMDERQKTILYAWNKNNVDMVRGSGQLPSARTHIIDELLPSFQNLIYGDEIQDYLEEQDDLKNLKLLHPNSIGIHAMGMEKEFFRRLHRFFSLLFGKNYWGEIIENNFPDIAMRIVKKKSKEHSENRWRYLSPDFKDVDQKNHIDWAEWYEIKDIFEKLHKDSSGRFENALKLTSSLTLKELITSIFFSKLDQDEPDHQSAKNGLKWMDFLSSIRNLAAHPRTGVDYTIGQKATFSFFESKYTNILDELDNFLDKNREQLY